MIVAAAVLLAAATVLVVVGVTQEGPAGDVAYASDPQAGLAADEAEAEAAARRPAMAKPVESGEAVAVRTTGLTTRAIDRPSVERSCRTEPYDFDDCVTVEIVMDALYGDCADCQDEYWVIYDTNTGRVTGLSRTDESLNIGYRSLANMGLTGVIPPELGDLTELIELTLGNNSILYDGPDNQLTGSVPPELGKLTNLTWLSLAGNELTGKIPSELAKLTNLERLYLYSNQLSGPIPPELGKLTNLKTLSLCCNQLTGPIPAELGKLTNLERLSLDSNQLTGCVPASLREAYEEAGGDDYPICQASPPATTPAPATPTPAATPADCTSNTALKADCETLLGMKSALRGSAKLNWWTGRSIEQWDGITVQGGRVTGLSLPNRSLDGILPVGLGSLTALMTLDLSGNSLTGQIPSELNNLANLTQWRLAGNNLTGCVPSTFAQVSDNDAADLNLPTCGGTSPSPTPTPIATPTPAPPGTTPTPEPTAEPGSTDARLTAIEGRLDDIEGKVASLEAAVAGLTGQTRLTDNSADDYVPSYSPDGRHIAFTSYRDGNGEIYVMNADGSGQTRLTDNSATDGGPSWSPDGRRIAFHSNRDGNWEIYVMNADGSGQARLTDNSAIDYVPSYSPDGRRIAFHSNRDDPDRNDDDFIFGIYVMNADGSGQTRLTDNSAIDGAPSWSPDGRRIAFHSDRDDPDRSDDYRIAGIYVMNADGSGQTRLTDNSATDASPSWSPDGRRIAFTSYRDGNGEIYVMNADGSGQTRLTHISATDAAPSWSPDGRRIAFHSNRDWYWEIYVMNADSFGQTRPTGNSAVGADPSWSPDGENRTRDGVGWDPVGQALLQ